MTFVVVISSERMSIVADDAHCVAGRVAAVSVTTYYVENTIEERLLSYRQVSGEVSSAGNSRGTATERRGTLAAKGDITVESEKEAALGVGMGAGIGGSDAQGLTAAKLRCIFGLTDDADAARAEEQARFDAVVEARARQAAAEAEAAMAEAVVEAAAAAGADLDDEDEDVIEENASVDFVDYEAEPPLAHGGMRATNSSSDSDSDVDLDDY